MPSNKKRKKPPTVPKDEILLDEQNVKKAIKQIDGKSSNAGGIFTGISGRGGRRKLSV